MNVMTWNLEKMNHNNYWKQNLLKIFIKKGDIFDILLKEIIAGDENI